MKILIDECPAGPWLDAAVAEAMGYKICWVESIAIGKPRHRPQISNGDIIEYLDTGEVVEDWRECLRFSQDIAAAWRLDDAGWLWRFKECVDGLLASVSTDTDSEFNCFVNWDGAKTTKQDIVEAYALARTRLFLKARGIKEVEMPDDA